MKVVVWGAWGVVWVLFAGVFLDSIKFFKEKSTNKDIISVFHAV